MKIIPISILIPFKRDQKSFSLWVQTRNSNDELNGKKEFPGGKIEVYETPLDACWREVKEETGVDLVKEGIELFKVYEHDYPSKTVLLNVFIYEDARIQFKQAGFLKLDPELSNFQDIPEANFRIIKDLWSHFCD